MFERSITNELIEAAKTFCAVTLTGPRQAGKTTLLKHIFSDHSYLNLEDPDVISRVKIDPRAYFDNTTTKWIIDEAQEYPELFSYLLGIIDKNNIKGQFILSGSKNFILLDTISQSLAGRTAVLELLPLSYSEMSTYKDYAKQDIWDLLYNGTYPGLYTEGSKTSTWYKGYVTTYLQRDVRQLLKVKDLSQFYLFLKLCAGRHGQLVNFNELGSACGVSKTTVSTWIDLLEMSFIIFKVRPYYKNFNKRITKHSKIYFYDPGLVCHLLEISSGEHAKMHSARGTIFEGYIISEIVKNQVSTGKIVPSVYFWKNNNGFEVDLLIEIADKIKAIEIKSSSTFTKDFLKPTNKWKKLVGSELDSSEYVVYSGKESFEIANTHVLSYRELEKHLVE